MAFRSDEPLEPVGVSPSSSPLRVLLFNDNWTKILIGLVEYCLTDGFWSGDEINHQLAIEHSYELVDILAGVSPMEIAIAKETKPNNTHGGSSVAATWNDRPVDTLELSSDFCRITSGTLHIDPGVYLVLAIGSAFGTRNTRLRFNRQSGVSYHYGLNNFVNVPADGYEYSHPLIAASFTETQTFTLRLEQYTESAVASAGLGLANNLGVPEVYSMIIVIKLR